MRQIPHTDRIKTAPVNTIVAVACGFELVLIGLTWRLWFGHSDFPVVPLVQGFTPPAHWPGQLVSVMFVVLVLIQLVMSVKSDSQDLTSKHKALLATVCCVGLFVVLFNQHRLQAWHWLFLIIVAIRAVCPATRTVGTVRLALAMVYICAGLSRIGPEVDGAMSLQLVFTALSMTGLSHLVTNEVLVSCACILMTVFEIAAGVMLLIRRTSRMASMLAVAMHVTLIILLSPVGLGHELGVLTWNLFFVTMHILLITQFSATPKSLGTSQLRSTHRAYAILVAFIVVFPLSGLVGLADNWLAWQLYSPRPEVVKVYVHSDAVEQLPESVKPFVGAPQPLDVWCPVRIDRWSLDQVGAPMYPEDRFQTAVASHLASFVESSRQIKVELDAPSIPDWWNRKTTLVSPEQSDR